MVDFSTRKGEAILTPPQITLLERTNQQLAEAVAELNQKLAAANARITELELKFNEPHDDKKAPAAPNAPYEPMSHPTRCPAGKSGNLKGDGKAADPICECGHDEADHFDEPEPCCNKCGCAGFKPKKEGDLYIYIAERESADYDEYDALCIIAPDEATVRSLIADGPIYKDIHDMCVASGTYYDGFTENNYTIQRIGTALDDAEPGVVLGSYNAG